MADPKFDETLGPDERLTVIKAIREFRREAEDARETRIARNRLNRDVFLGRQDWSHKRSGQSAEFLPKLSVAAEQMGSFIKRGLVQFGDWFSVRVDAELEGTVGSGQIVRLLDCFLRNLWAGNNKSTAINIILGDAAKNGLLESLMILKVHGGMTKRRRLVMEPGELEVSDTGEISPGEPEATFEEEDEWRLRVDLVRPEDYYPDPTGAGLYEIHRVERDLHEVQRMAEEGTYDKEAVKQLIDTTFTRPEDEERSDHDRDQQEATEPGFRKRVVLDEFWGTLLNDDGTIAHENIVATIANDRFLIRPPEPNPFWHQESPFVVSPLTRVPWSVWHKALYDNAAQLNLALNEMFNLMLDGGISAVWGIKQVRIEDLEDPSQISGGIQQGSTLAVKSTLPHQAKVLETVSEGNVPQDAMAIFEFVDREFTQAALTNEVKLGNLPAKQVRATEIVEASQSQALTLDGIVSDLESGFINDLLRKSWLTILQNADSLPEDAFTGILDRRAALMIMRAPAAERFQLFAGRCNFRVFGLSATMTSVRNFQKFMAMLQAISSNPVLLQGWMQRMSVDRTLDSLMRFLNINPADLEKNAEEKAQAQAEMQRTQQAAQLLGGGAEGGLGGGATGDSGMQAEVNQNMAPITGMTGNG